MGNDISMNMWKKHRRPLQRPGIESAGAWKVRTKYHVFCESLQWSEPLTLRKARMDGCDGGTVWLLWEFPKVLWIRLVRACLWGQKRYFRKEESATVWQDHKNNNRIEFDISSSSVFRWHGRYFQSKY